MLERLDCSTFKSAVQARRQRLVFWAWRSYFECSVLLLDLAALQPDCDNVWAPWALWGEGAHCGGTNAVLMKGAQTVTSESEKFLRRALTHRGEWNHARPDYVWNTRLKIENMEHRCWNCCGIKALALDAYIYINFYILTFSYIFIYSVYTEITTSAFI